MRSLDTQADEKKIASHYEAMQDLLSARDPQKTPRTIETGSPRGSVQIWGTTATKKTRTCDH